MASNVTKGMPASSSGSVAWRVTPSFTRFASVSTSGFSTWWSRSSSASLRSACAPQKIFVGQEYSNACMFVLSDGSGVRSTTGGPVSGR